MKKGLVIFAIWACALILTLRWHERTSGPSLSILVPVSASASLDHDDFDTAKRDRQWDWCVAHGGIPTMTFTHAGSNVLCLRPTAVIPLPAEK